MRPEDLSPFVRARPFRPFRIHLSGGTTYEIHHPEFAMIGRSTVIVGLPGPGDDGNGEPFFDRAVHCALMRVTRAELVNGPMTA